MVENEEGKSIVRPDSQKTVDGPAKGLTERSNASGKRKYGVLKNRIQFSNDFEDSDRLIDELFFDASVDLSE